MDSTNMDLLGIVHMIRQRVGPGSKLLKRSLNQRLLAVSRAMKSVWSDRQRV